MRLGDDFPGWRSRIRPWAILGNRFAVKMCSMPTQGIGLKTNDVERQQKMWVMASLEGHATVSSCIELNVSDQLLTWLEHLARGS
jgi:hypothetical protein